MRSIQKIMITLSLMLPTLAMAHPGHHHHDANFWTGFIHPFTGLDHLMMAISFGVLMWSVAKQWKVVGALGLVTALVVGFNLGAMQALPIQWAEYGIVGDLPWCGTWCRVRGQWSCGNADFRHGFSDGAHLYWWFGIRRNYCQICPSR